MNKQSGFTLIELVVVIVILGILAATAVPKFIDLSGEANAAAVKGIAGAIASASAINYGAAAAGSASKVTTANVTCATAANALLTSPVDASFTVAGGTTAAGAGATTTCTVSKGGKTANALVISVL